MDKTLYCRDLGNVCDVMLCDKTEEEVIKKAGEHIQAVHQMKGFSKEFYNRARAVIQDGSCEPGTQDIGANEEKPSGACPV